MEIRKPGILDLIQPEDEALDVYMAFVLLWLAAADGSLSRESLDYLYQHHRSLPNALDRADKLLAIIAADEMDSYLLACHGLRQGLAAEDRKTFLNRAIATLCAAGRLSIAGNHTLRFISDLLDFSDDELASAYREETGQELSEPGDPSSVEWWAQHDAAESSSKPAAVKPGSRQEAYAILGLSGDASQTAVKKAYRRLVQHHHPDRVAGLDMETRRVAEQKFIQVQQAYELLRK